MGNELPKMAVTVNATAVRVSGAAPLSRDAAAAVALSDTELLLFGGGSGGGEEGGALQFDDVWVLTLPPGGGDASWRQVETQGERPCARTGHALVCVDAPGGGRTVLVIGGCSAAHGFLADAHVLDCRTWTWAACVPNEHAPTPRDKLSAVAFGDRVLIFGGFGPQDAAAAGSDSSEGEEEAAADEEADEEEEEGGEDAGEAASFTWFNDLRVLQCESGAWAWSAPVTQGEAPSARAAHGAAAVGGQMLVFGGRDAGGRTNDTHQLDVATLTWTRVAAEAPAPAARSFHTLAAVGGPGAVCFGGIGSDGAQLDSMEVLDMRDAPVWVQPQERAGQWPPTRAAAAVAMLGARLVVVSTGATDGQSCACTLLECGEVQKALLAAKSA